MCVYIYIMYIYIYIYRERERYYSGTCSPSGRRPACSGPACRSPGTSDAQITLLVLVKSIVLLNQIN